MEDLILDKYSKLPKELQSQVLDYIDFLVTKYQEQFSVIPGEPQKSNFGSAKGMISMSDDFDEPLDDFSEYQ